MAAGGGKDSRGTQEPNSQPTPTPSDVAARASSRRRASRAPSPPPEASSCPTCHKTLMRGKTVRREFEQDANDAGQHELELTCDSCGEVLSLGAYRYCCRQHDYDLCEACALPAAASSGGQGTAGAATDGPAGEIAPAYPHSYRAHHAAWSARCAAHVLGNRRSGSARFPLTPHPSAPHPSPLTPHPSPPYPLTPHQYIY